MSNPIRRYFDLYSDYRPRNRGLAPGDGGPEGGDDIAWWRQLLVYLACITGVLTGPYVSSALAGNAPTVAKVLESGNHLFWSAIIALAVFPVIYKLVLDPHKPLLVQMAFGLVSGFIAQKIVPLAIELISKAAGLA